MYGSTKNDSAPPEVPKEFAETYRQAFAKAMAGMSQTPQVDPPRVVPVQREAEGPTTATYVPTRPDTQGVRISGPLFAENVGKQGAGFWAQLRRSALFVPVIVAFVALLVVGSAYVIGALGAGGIGEQGQTTSSMADAAYDGPVAWQHGCQPTATAERLGKWQARAPSGLLTADRQQLGPVGAWVRRWPSLCVCRRPSRSDRSG